MNRFERRQARKDERTAAMPTFFHLHSLKPKKSGRDLFAKSELTPGQIYFMRFVGVRTSKHWIIDDDYRRWTKQIFQQRCSLRQMWEEGAARMRSL